MKRVIAVTLIFTMIFCFNSLASDYCGFDCSYAGSNKVTLTNYEKLGTSVTTSARIIATLGQPTKPVRSYTDPDGIRYDIYEWESFNIVPWIRITFRNGIYNRKSCFMLKPTAADL